MRNMHYAMQHHGKCDEEYVMQHHAVCDEEYVMQHHGICAEDYVMQHHGICAVIGTTWDQIETQPESFNHI